MRSSVIFIFSVLILALFVSGCTATAKKPHLLSGEDLESAVKRPSDHALHQGKLHYRNRDYGLAEKYFRYAVEVNATSIDGWLGLAASYDNLRRFDLAQRAYKVVIKQGGYTPTVLNNLGYHEMLRGKLSEARKYLERAEQMDPGNPHVQNNLRLLETWPTSHGARPPRI